MSDDIENNVSAAGADSSPLPGSATVRNVARSESLNMLTALRVIKRLVEDEAAKTPGAMLPAFLGRIYEITRIVDRIDAAICKPNREMNKPGFDNE